MELCYWNIKIAGSYCIYNLYYLSYLLYPALPYRHLLPQLFLLKRPYRRSVERHFIPFFHIYHYGKIAYPPPRTRRANYLRVLWLLCMLLANGVARPASAQSENTALQTVHPDYFNIYNCFPNGLASNRGTAATSQRLTSGRFYNGNGACHTPYGTPVRQGTSTGAEAARGVLLPGIAPGTYLLEVVSTETGARQTSRLHVQP